MDGSKELVACCGVYCGDCFSYKGEIADMARELRKKLREEKFTRVAQGLSGVFKDFQNYEQCYQVLGAMVRLRCKKACLEGGGNPFCAIRKCCQGKKLQGCWECQGFENCDRFEFLKTVHKDANLKNLRELKKQGIEDFLKGTRYW